MLGIPSIRDRVVQGALGLILEPIFEADSQGGSFGYRPGRTAHEAVDRVEEAIKEGKTRVIDLDLRAYFDNVRHHILLAKVAVRVADGDVMHLLKLILKATGAKGVPQGGVISPLLSNIYLNEVDRMLEKAREITCEGERTRVQYARFADDLVVLVDGHPRHDRLLRQVSGRIREELARLEVEVNEEKSRTVDLAKGESFGYLGFDIRRVRSRSGRWWVPRTTPKLKKRTDLLARLREVFSSLRSQPVQRVITLINPMLKRTGEPCAGNPHARFDWAGIGNGLTATTKRARSRKRRRPPSQRLRGTAPVPDPTIRLFDRPWYDISSYRGAMSKAKLAVTLDSALVAELDELVAKRRFANRSQAVEEAVAEKLERMAKTRLARESAKLDRDEERALAEEGLAAGRETWPEY